jgi:NTE family protein
LTHDTNHDQPTVVFVLSGGASLGAVHVGMLRALYERGIAADAIVGTSAGAIHGAFIASRPQTPATADALGAVWRSVRRRQTFPLNPVTGLFGLFGARKHLISDSGLRRLLAPHLQCEVLEQTATALHVVAVDVLSGEELLLSRGPLLHAVLASAAIPGLLPPVAWEGHTLIDGSVANNTPLSHAVALGAQRIYVLPAGHTCALNKPPSGALAMALHAITLLTHRRLIDDIVRHRDDAELIVLPCGCPLPVQPIDFAHADELIAQSLQDARAFFDRVDAGKTVGPNAANRTWSNSQPSYS